MISPALGVEAMITPQVPRDRLNWFPRTPSAREARNQVELFLYLPDRIHEVSMCIKQVLHDLIPTALSQ